MLVTAQGALFAYSTASDNFLHGLQNMIFSKPTGILQFQGGRDILIKRARLVVVGLRRPRRPSSQTDNTYFQIESVNNPGEVAEINIIDLEEWVDVNMTVRADSSNNDWQIKVKSGVPVPQSVFIDPVNVQTIYNGVNVYCELQMDIKGFEV